MFTLVLQIQWINKKITFYITNYKNISSPEARTELQLKLVIIILKLLEIPQNDNDENDPQQNINQEEPLMEE